MDTQVHYNHTTHLTSLGTWVQSSPPGCVHVCVQPVTQTPPPPTISSASDMLTHVDTPHPSLLILPACIPWRLLLKVKCYSRSKVTINMAEIVSLSFPRGPDTENNFPFSLASADTGVNEDIQPPGPAACSR